MRLINRETYGLETKTEREAGQCPVSLFRGSCPQALEIHSSKVISFGFQLLKTKPIPVFFSWSFLFFFQLSLIFFFLCSMRLKLLLCLCGKYNLYINVKRKNFFSFFFSLPAHKKHFYLILKAQFLLRKKTIQETLHPG